MGQAAIPVPVLGAGFIGGVPGHACGYLEGKAVGYVTQGPTKVTLPTLNSYTSVILFEISLKCWRVDLKRGQRVYALIH